jgi:hypothetical protein
MHISLTVGDVLLTVFITIVGGFFVIYAYPFIPRYWAVLITFSAQTSERFAALRLRSLTRQLEQVKQLRADPSKHNGWTTAILGDIVVFVGLAVFLLVASITAIINMVLASLAERLRSLKGALDDVERRSVDLPADWSSIYGVDLAPGTILLLTTSVVLCVGAMWLAMALASKLRRFGNLEERERFLNDQIESLCARYPALR